MSEFTRFADARHIDARPHRLVASEAECAALAKRFGLVAIHRLEGEVVLEREGDAILADGAFEADIVQSCAVSGEDFPVAIAEPLELRFVSIGTRPPPEGEVELDPNARDEIEYEGTQIDLGEAVAESLALAIDPYAEGPNAEAARKAAGLTDEAASGPFAALAALKKQ